MPLQHIVWLKKKDHCTDIDMQDLLNEVCRLTDFIPNIGSITSGKNITSRANGFTHGVIVTLADQQALDAYIRHPAHLAVGKKLAAVADILAMDYQH